MIAKNQSINHRESFKDNKYLYLDEHNLNNNDNLPEILLVIEELASNFQMTQD